MRTRRGFPNEKHIGNNPVHAGDAGLGSGTTARQCPGAEQWTGNRPEFAGAGCESIPTINARRIGSGRVAGPGVKRACHRGLPGGSDPNFTLTDRANITYKLKIPPNADTSKLTPHVGESVVVAGDVKDPGKTSSPSIDVHGIGRGTGKCPASDSKGLAGAAETVVKSDRSC